MGRPDRRKGGNRSLQWSSSRAPVTVRWMPDDSMKKATEKTIEWMSIMDDRRVAMRKTLHWPDWRGKVYRIATKPEYQPLNAPIL